LGVPSLLTTLLILMIGLLIARLLAGRLARWAVPAIVLELLVGFALGNTLLPFASIAPLSGLTELGVLTLFFQVGMEVRSDLLSASAFTILRLVGLSCLTPLLAFWPLTHGFAMAAPTAWLCLAVLSATGTGVTLRLLSQRSALRTPSGRLLVAVSVLDDLPAIGLLSLAMASGGSSLAKGSQVGPSLWLGLLAAAASYWLSGWWGRQRPSQRLDALTVLILLIGSAWLGEISGFTSLLGALWGGILLNRLVPVNGEASQMLEVLSEVFLPLYFISVGMRLSAETLLQPKAWLLALALVGLGVLSKLICGLGVSGADRARGVDRQLVVFGLIPRGLPGLVFATTALSAGLINGVEFSALVLMVTVTTVLGLLLLDRRIMQLNRVGQNPST
jgi:Kef-type K+ transport system membrane component KefB